MTLGEYDIAMADSISKSDIQHAMESALHGVRNDVSRIAHTVDGMNRVSQDVKELAHRLVVVEQSVNNIQNVVANTLGRPTTRRYPDPYIVGIANELNDLKLRFASIERFAQQVNEYMRSQVSAAEDDRQYRSA